MTKSMILDGSACAKEIEAKLKARIGEHVPGLAFVLVGNEAASKVYVSRKKAACARVGIRSTVIHLPENTETSAVIKTLQQLNEDSSIHAILLQLPLPKQIETQRVLSSIDPRKDVDGFHPFNLGKLFSEDESGFVPCTPKGILTLLRQNGIDTCGKHAVILGRSQIVGRPMAALLMRKSCNATVTIAHSRSENLKELTRRADILIAAIGSPHFIQEDMVKPGAVIIDVGINRQENGAIVGDVHFESVSKKVLHITPVPGGVGPMTIASLLENSVDAFERLCYNRPI